MAVGSGVGAEMARMEEKGVDLDGGPGLWRLRTWMDKNGVADFGMERARDGVEFDNELIRSGSRTWR